MARHRLTDEQWERIADIFPPRAATGRTRTDPRLVVDAILWILRVGGPWRDLPEDEFAPWETIYGFFNTWNADGTLDKILDRLRAARIDVGRIDQRLWCIDGTIVRAHRCAAGGGKKGTRKSRLIMH
jgi:transposase